MVPIFPLGVKKDTAVEPWFKLNKPAFEAKSFTKAVGATTEATGRHCEGFPTHLNPTDVSLKLAGSGGDGAQTAAMLIATAAINEGFDGTHIPSYGPESRGGTSYADVHVAKDEVLNPGSPTPDILLAFNAPSLAKFGLTVKKGGCIIYDNSIAKDVKPADPSIKVVGVPFTEIAAGLGKLVVKNIVALGALQAATEIFPKETFLAAIRQALKDKASLIPLNEQAFDAGIQAAKEFMAAHHR
jgi:Pyruvate/2-oxoacid:ferredoxin oxidoreductase gamma subunit